MMKEMKNELKAALAIQYPVLKPYQIERAVDKYVNSVMSELATQISMGNVTNGEIDFACDTVRAQCGRIVIDNKQRYHTF